mgnify:CR=1 FL=1
MKRRLAAIVCAAALGVTSLTGCASGKQETTAGTETAAAAAKARLMCLPYGKAILSMEDFALSDDGDTNNARLAHALLCCCSAVMGADSAAKGGKIHGKEKGK